MDSTCDDDGVFVGRHVLVEYDTDTSLKTTYYGQYIEDLSAGVKNLALYPDDAMENAYRLTLNDIEPGTVVRAMVQEEGESKATLHFYSCTSGSDGLSHPLFKGPLSSEDNAYVYNYQIDKEEYGKTDSSFRGYDSTVWIKVSKPTEDGSAFELHYVQIADLNSVVPDFDVIADAPTPQPLAPHFDAGSSSNLHYDLHVQTPYGFQVKQAANEKSDVEATSYITTYDSETNEVEVKLGNKYDAAIYFNKAGFDKEKRSYDDSGSNYIKIEPTGSSGNTYAHKNNLGDMQELSIQLPAIGNAVSDVYDVLHGIDRDDNKSSSLQGILNSFEEIPTQKLLIKGSSGVIVGANTQGDDYIEVSASANELAGELSVKHKDANVYIDAQSIDLNTTGEDTISTVRVLENETGHIKERIAYDITLPYGYKYIKAGDNTSSATSTQDTYELKSGNNIEITSSNNIATIKHKEDDNGALTSIAEGTSLISGITTDAARHIQEVSYTALTKGNDQLKALGEYEAERVLYSLDVQNRNGNIVLDTTYLPVSSLPTIQAIDSDLTSVQTELSGTKSWINELQERTKQIWEKLYEQNIMDSNWDNTLGPDSGEDPDDGDEDNPSDIFVNGKLIISRVLDNGNGSITSAGANSPEIKDFTNSDDVSTIAGDTGSTITFIINENVITKKVKINVSLSGLNSSFEINGVTQTVSSTADNVSTYEYVGIPEGEIKFVSSSGLISFANFEEYTESSPEDPDTPVEPSSKEIFDDDGNVLISNIIYNGTGSVRPSDGTAIEFNSNSTQTIITSTSSPLVLNIGEKAGLEGKYMTINVAIEGTDVSTAYMEMDGTLFDPDSTENGYITYSYTGTINGILTFRANSGTEIIFSAFKKTSESSEEPEPSEDLLDENRNVNLSVLNKTVNVNDYKLENNVITSSSSMIINLSTSLDLANYSDYETHFVVKVNSKKGSVKVGDTEYATTFNANEDSVLGIFYGKLADDITITGGTKVEFKIFKIDSEISPLSPISCTWEEAFGSKVYEETESEREYITISENTLTAIYEKEDESSIADGSDVLGLFILPFSDKIKMSSLFEVSSSSNNFSIQTAYAFPPGEQNSGNDYFLHCRGFFEMQISENDNSVNSITFNNIAMQPSNSIMLLPTSSYYIDSNNSKYIQGKDGYFYSEENEPYDENFATKIVNESGYINSNKGTLIIPNYTGTIYVWGGIDNITATVGEVNVEDSSFTRNNITYHYATIEANNETVKISSPAYLYFK